MDPLAVVRRAVADAVRERVVGPGGLDRQQSLVDEQGPRWFAPDRPVRAVHSDVSMFVGGLRALLLQSLHPLVMAGVAQHSDYRSDPWGRLQRTADFLGTTTFGTVAQAERACGIVRSVHGRVQGIAPDGRAYRATDPHLLAWVHITEVDSFLRAHDRYGAHRLTPAEADGYVADMAIVARALGVLDPPTTRADLATMLRSYRAELASTPDAREAARFLLAPPIPVVAMPAYAVLAAAAVGLLPAWTRWPLRLPYLPLTEALAVRPAGDALVRGLRWALTPTSALT